MPPIGCDDNVYEEDVSFYVRVYLTSADGVVNMCQCAAHPLRLACIAGDTCGVKTLLANGTIPACNCSLIDATLAGPRRSQVEPRGFTLAMAATVQALVGEGITQTDVDPPDAIAHELIQQLKINPINVANFIAAEGCACGGRLQAIIEGLGEARPLPIPPCPRC